MRHWFYTALSSTAVALVSPRVAAQTYRVERIASGLSQPTYVTQAPGDPANILYFTERTSNTIAGFDPVNQMGKVWRYDVSTRTRIPVLDLSARGVINDDGLQTIAFHPDFGSPGTPGHRKMYVSSAQRGTVAVNRVEEYTMNAAGTFGSGRVILEYNNNRQNNHTVNWVGFDPTATGPARNYLYISAGDGSFGNDYNNGTSPTGRPSQNPGELHGKILRVDVSGPDAYASDNKNFAIPPTNPIPAFNAANPGSPIVGLGEVLVTGVRNTSRMSFDRATGDMYLGDVGETAIEEVSFIKAGTTTGPRRPVDIGWPQKEGTQNSNIIGAPHTNTNPFTNATSIAPIRQFGRTPGGNAVIGGYVYDGPVSELRGKYFYADFVPGRVWQLDFDRETNPTAFAGNNGTLTEMTALWNSMVVDPTDPSYTPAIGNLFGIDHVSSFGQDNAGNLYIVDFGHGTGFQGQYPAAGLGEIFRITPLPPGDADLDGDVDVQDFLAIDRGRALRLTGWASGDFTGDGTIDAQDYTLIDRAFLSQQSALAAPVALVPEPTTLTVLGISFAALLTRNRFDRRCPLARRALSRQLDKGLAPGHTPATGFSAIKNPV